MVWKSGKTAKNCGKTYFTCLRRALCPPVWQCTRAVPSIIDIIYERYANVTQMYIKIVPRTQMFLQTFL